MAVAVILELIEISVDLTRVTMILSGVKTLINDKLRSRTFPQCSVFCEANCRFPASH